MQLRVSGSIHRATRTVLAVLLVLSHPLWAATIVVDEATCTLVDAVTSANTDSAVGGCTAGSGSDTIELTSDVMLTSVNNVTNYDAGNGLPVVASDITVEGGGFVIERAATAPRFRFFHVLSSGTLALNDLTLRNGRLTWYGSYGGAIESYGTVVLTDCAVTGNSATFNGGGIRHHGPGALVLVNSTVSGNSVGSDEFDAISSGGGIAVSGGAVSVTNSTVSGNTANSYRWLNCFDCPPTERTGRGGGIIVWGSSVNFTNSTLSGNSANYGAGGIENNGTVSLANTIVANAGNCGGSLPTDNGNNFSDDDTCGAGFAALTPGVDLDIFLAGNGGSTRTHALPPGSVAIDAAGDCGLDTDQRGFPRDDAECDSGSFERQVSCGSGAVDPFEECDDGNNISCDGCSAACVIESGFCGDGVLDQACDEECDEAGESATCDDDCTLPGCGDGNHNTAAGEECDDGNNVDGDWCQANCVLPVCGDGILDAGEECDDGNNADDDGCAADCTLECGDGILDPGEECDDGNLVDGDGCDSNCTPTACGNGIVSAGEECDDGNNDDGDGCNANCQITDCSGMNVYQQPFDADDFGNAEVSDAEAGFRVFEKLLDVSPTHVTASRHWGIEIDFTSPTFLCSEDDAANFNIAFWGESDGAPDLSNQIAAVNDVASTETDTGVSYFGFGNVVRQDIFFGALNITGAVWVSHERVDDQDGCFWLWIDETALGTYDDQAYREDSGFLTADQPFCLGDADAGGGQVPASSTLWLATLFLTLTVALLTLTAFVRRRT